MTNLRIAVLQHEPETGLGAFADLLDQARVDYVMVDTLSGPLPDAEDFAGAIALGGSLNAYDPKLLETRRWTRNAVLRDLPFFAVCLGGQLLASALGAAVEPQARPELGVHDIYLTDAGRRDPLFVGLAGRLSVFGWHGDCFGLPPGALPLAGSIACSCQAFRFGVGAYGIQFHPEVRAADLSTWAGVAGYRPLFERARAVDTLATELEWATPALDALAAQLIERWLVIAGRAAAGRPRRVAV